MEAPSVTTMLDNLNSERHKCIDWFDIFSPFTAFNLVLVILPWLFFNDILCTFHSTFWSLAYMEKFTNRERIFTPRQQRGYLRGNHKAPVYQVNILFFSFIFIHHPCFSTARNQRKKTRRKCECVDAKLLHSCPTLCDPVDYSPQRSSVHGISPGKNTGVGCHALIQEIFLTQGLNLNLLLLLHQQVGTARN